MKIFVADDEQKDVAFLTSGLGENGFNVEVCGDGLEAARRALCGTIDLIILNAVLPRRDGWAVLSDLRSAGVATPLLMMGVCGTVDCKVKALELGADDYLSKPCAFSELLARVRTLLRRSQPHSTVRIADLEIDFSRQRASRHGTRLELTGREFAILSLLVRHNGEVLSRAVIADQIWGMNFQSGTNVVDVAIHRLRAKVDRPGPPLIHCSRGRGYVLEPR